MVVTFQGRETNEVGTGPQRGIWEVSAFGHMGFTLWLITTLYLFKGFLYVWFYNKKLKNREAEEDGRSDSDDGGNT